MTTYFEDIREGDIFRGAEVIVDKAECWPTPAEMIHSRFMSTRNWLSTSPMVVSRPALATRSRYGIAPLDLSLRLRLAHQDAEPGACRRPLAP